MALAKGDGCGNAGGNSSNAGGNSKGNGNAFGLGNSVQGKSNKSANNGFSSNNKLENDHKAVSAQLGRLNAAHASATARANASPNSAVGLLGQYEAAVNAARDATSEEERADLEQAAIEILGQAANKELNEEVTTAVNSLLGIEPALETETDINSNTDPANTET